MKTIRKSAVAVRAERLNQPEMVDRYSEMAINETETHYELIDEDWVELNLQWNEKSDKTTNKPKNNFTNEIWNRTVKEIRESGNTAWNELLDLKLDLFKRLTYCQSKARKKKLIEDWTVYKGKIKASERN